MKKMTALFAVSAACIGLSTMAKEASLADVKDLKSWKNAKLVEDGKALEATNSKLVCSKIFPLNPKSAYVLSGMFKSGNDKKNRVYFGMQFFDAKKHFISPTTVTPVEKSATELVEDCKKGTKIIKLKEASKLTPWVKKQRLCIGFDSDKGLPNKKLSAKVVKLEKKGDVWEATLQKPLSFACPKGTKVQGHALCGHYMYVVAITKNFKEWTKLSGSVRPEVKAGSPGKSIWPGAKFGRVIVLANWGQKKGEVLQMKDISLTEKTK
jgi:hypothetical protein